MKDLVRRAYNGINYLLTSEIAAPAGAATQVQYNNAGTMSADSNFTWDNTNRQLEIGATTGNGAIGLYGDTTDPVAEPGKVLIYAKNMANRIMPKWVGPSGVDMPFQACLGMNGIKQVAPASGTSATTCMTAFATGVTNVASSLTQVAVTATSIMTRMRSVRFASSSTSGNVASHRSTVQEVCGAGGYFFVARFYISAMQNTNRGFFGLWGATGAATNINPLTSFATNKIGLAFNTNTGNWNLVSSTTTAISVVALGASMPINTTDVIELMLFCVPGGTSIGYRVNNLTTGIVINGTLSTNIPAVTVALAVNMWMTNNTTSAAVAFGLNKWYLESDY
jgi:hypothetical protein